MSSGMTRKEMGDLGERIAKKYLEKRGFYVERENWTDLVVYDEKPRDYFERREKSVSCEVKTSKDYIPSTPPPRQRRNSDLVAQVQIREMAQGEVSFKIRFRRYAGWGMEKMEPSLDLPLDWEEERYVIAGG
nr:hypothetical protein [uncultured archaeon]